MNGVSIVETKVLENLISTVEQLQNQVVSTLKELKDERKPYLSAQEVMEYTGFGKTWLNDNKSIIGFTKIGQDLRFKRKDLEAFMEANYFKIKNKKKCITH